MVTNVESKSLYIDESSAIFIRKAFELFLTGDYSLRKLSEKLVSDGYYYTSSKPKISHNVLEGILKNVMYTGRMMCNGIVYQGKHSAIISPQLFDKVQDAFKKVDKSKVRKNFEFLYSGIVKCGSCGYAFSAEYHKRISYYRCTQHDRTCTNTSYISEKQLTSAFRRHLRRIGLDEKLYELIKKCLKESLGDEQKFHKQEISRINKEISTCTEILKKMYLDQINNILDKELWISIKNEY